jgi:hypothetical protein
MIAAALALHLHAVAPEISDARARAHAAIAVEAATAELPPELLLSVAYVESRLDAAAVSRVSWAQAYGFCGPLQTIAATEAECTRQRDLGYAYRLGVAELTWWLRYCHGDVARALAGHGCGVAGATTGKCNGYAARVLAFAERIR